MSLKLDLGELEFKKEILDFKSGDGVKLFFFAGHGWNLKGRNYLFPIDAPQESDLLAGKDLSNLSAVGDIYKSVRGKMLVLLDTHGDPVSVPDNVVLTFSGSPKNPALDSFRMPDGTLSRHSPYWKASLISLECFKPAIAVDAVRRTVTISGGVRYEQLCGELHKARFALHNMGSLPHITVAGACATGTHGSGDSNGNLATAVAAMEVVTGTGDVVVLSREQHGDQFDGAVVGLGGLGIVTSLTLDIQPTFDMRQDVYENLPLAVRTREDRVGVVDQLFRLTPY